MTDLRDNVPADDQAFDRALPRRLSLVQQRVRALADSSWDVNTLHVLNLDVAGLAREGARLQRVDVSNRLYALHELLEAGLSMASAPGPEWNAEVTRALGALSDYSDYDETPVELEQRPLRRVQGQTLPEPVITRSGLPDLANVARYIVPPEGFVPAATPAQRVAVAVVDDPPAGARETGPAPAGGAEEEIRVGALRLIDPLADPMAAPEEDRTGQDGMKDEERPGEQRPADPTGTRTGEDTDLDTLFAEIETDVEGPGASTRAAGPGGAGELELDAEAAAEAMAFGPKDGRLTLYLLHGDSAATAKLRDLLEKAYEVESFTDPGEFLEMLGAIGPDAVILDSAHLDRVADIGPIVQKLRAKTHGRLALVVYAPPSDVETRLKMMRAGADVFISTELPVEIACARIAEQVQAAPDDPYRVMIVEDDQSQALFAKSILSRAGMEAMIEQQPLRVLEAMEEFRPDLLLMDLHMPGCDGMELTTIIRDHEEFVHLPIVFLSGDEDEDIHFDALLAGGDDFLTKPIRPRHLISAVKNRILRARMQRTGRGEAVAAEPAASSAVAARARLVERLDQHLERSEGGGGLIYLEIDRPYAIRRQYGLPFLEKLADEVVDRLAAAVQEGDLFARYGDTVLCLLVGEGDLDALERRARALMEQVSESPVEIDGRSARVTVSVGLCGFDEDFSDSDAMIAAAERACNRDAEQETARIGIHRTRGVEADATLRVIGGLIREALDENRFKMAYQPIASLHGEDLEQYQCLLRLPREDDEPLATARVIAAAEQLGLLGDIDRWVVQQASDIIAGEAGRAKPLRLFVNQSGEVAGEAAMAEWIVRCLSERGISGSSLVLEIKLPDVARHLQDVLALQERLRSHGVSFCLGHFDGGETGFRMLEDYRAEFVKLSPQVAFRQLQEGRLDATVERLKGLGARVIVVGVEEAQLAVQLWSAGVDFIQGHLVQEPESNLSYHFANAG